MKTIETLDPKAFRGLITTIGELPSSFVDSMSYYEMIAWLVDYIKSNVIPAVNNNAEAIAEIQKWIETLDLQSYVDTKLDEMAASGELAEIISQYLNSTAIFAYDSVADMKDAENLIDGSYARTLGYYAKNDGGAGLYKIRNITNDDMIDEGSIIAMGDGSDELVAELITNEANFAQFGAKGDGTTDDTTATQNALAYAKAKKIPLTAPANKVYKIEQSLRVDNLNVNLNDSTLKAGIALNELILINIIDDVAQTDWYGELCHVKLDCTNVTEGLNITMGRKKNIHDVDIYNVSKFGIYYHTGYEVHIHDCHITGVGFNDNNYSADSVGIRANGGDSHFSDLIIVNCAVAVYNRGLNFYSRIHGWTKTHALAPSAIFFRCGGNVPAYLSQCYSDTFGTTFSMRDAWIICDQLFMYFNTNIYEAGYAAPKFFVAEDIGGEFDFSSSYQRLTTITNSTICGARAAQQLTYRNWTGTNYVKTANNNVKRVSGYNGANNTTSLTAGTAVTEITSQRVSVRSDMANINLVVKVDTSVNTSFTVTGLPTTLQPNGEVNTGLFWGDNNVNTVDGFGYLKISGGTISGKIIGADENAVVYAKINVTYPLSSFAIEY